MSIYQGETKVAGSSVGHGIGFIGNHYITGACSVINSGAGSTWAAANFGGGNKALAKVGIKSNLIENNSGAVLYTHDGTISFIEVDIILTGNTSGAAGGIWWGANANPLNGAVLLFPQSDANNVLCHLSNAGYGSVSNKYIFDVSSMAVGATLYINPVMAAYAGNFTPNNGGTKSYITLKGYMK